MEAKTKSYWIKLPSNTGVVSVKTLWNTIKTISSTGSTFTIPQLIQCGLYTKVDDYISRNLAYLKYLGFLKETREKVKNGDKTENIQKFLILEDKNVNDIIYDLKANREDSAKSKFGNLLKNHELYLGLKNEFFNSSKIKTFIDLEHFVKEKNPGKNPVYYQNGGKFIMKLLEQAKLVSVSGNNIELIDSSSREESKEKSELGPSENYSTKGDKEKDDNQQLKIEADDNTYTIKINGPDTNSTWIVKSKKQLAVVKSIIDLIESGLDE